MSEISSDAPSLRESPKPRPDEWLKSGEYLPDFMRDFHDQKELFKALQEVVERRNAKPNSYTEGLNWIMAHVYSVDVLLWVLARHGYTLQRSRKRIDFADIGNFIGEAAKRDRAAAAEVLREAFASARKDGSSQQASPASPAVLSPVGGDLENAPGTTRAATHNALPPGSETAGGEG